MTRSKTASPINDAERLLTEVRSTAKSAGCHIVAAPLDNEHAACPTVVLETDEVLLLVAAIQPPILYVFATDLDVEQEVATAISEVGVERGDRAFADITRAGRRLAAHQGHPARTSVEIMVGGVLHLAYAAAFWISAFENEVETISARVSEAGSVRLHPAGGEQTSGGRPWLEADTEAIPRRSVPSGSSPSPSSRSSSSAGSASTPGSAPVGGRLEQNKPLSPGAPVKARDAA